MSGAPKRPVPETGPTLDSMDTRKFGDVTLHTMPLDPMVALDIAPEVFEIVGPAIAAVRGGHASLGDLAGAIGKALAGGRLTRLLPQLLSGTTMIVDGKVKIDLLSRDAVGKALALRPGMLIPLVVTAVEVQLMRFFTGLDQLGIEIPMRSGSPDSSPSTTATGPSTG